MSKIKYVVVHHTAVSYKKNADQWKATNNYHKKKWGFKSSLGYYGGYNYEISKAGGLKQFRKEGEVTAAQYQKNMNNGKAISICLDGNFDVEFPTDKQLETLRKLIIDLIDKYKIKPKNILKHRDLAKYKSCPGKNIPNNLYRYLFPEEFGINTIDVKIYRDSPDNGAKFYLYGKDGKYHHIVDEGLFVALFGGFSVDAEVGAKLYGDKVGFSIKSSK